MNLSKPSATAAAVKDVEKSKKEHDDLLMLIRTFPDKIQIRLKRDAISCNCSECILASQPDFAEQKSGVVEAFEKFNADNNVAYICVPAKVPS
jgi:hypothetical protein